MILEFKKSVQINFKNENERAEFNGRIMKKCPGAMFSNYQGVSGPVFALIINKPATPELVDYLRKKLA